ncbi:MAG TPA: FkbM family methyltransferase [Ignavibacteria bacterium]|nr:FkbM family methyltransferase [Ignavibacteria bacterium]
MKNKFKSILQNILGFNNYLFVFSIFKILTLKFDKEEGKFLNFLKLLPKDAVVLDIGANIGIMTVLLAKRCTNGQIHSFEPIDENYNTLIKIIDFFRLKNVKSYKLALGERNAKAKMIMPINNSIKLQGLPHVITENDSNEKGNEYEVELKSLDSFGNNELKKIHAIKIDVENYEYFVFKGAQNLLMRDKPIIYTELWDNEFRIKTIEFLSSLGYEVNVFDNNSFEKFDPAIHITENFFFFPTD